MTLEEAKEALTKYFNDRSRSRGETLDGLEELGAEIEGMIDALHDDERRENS